MVAGAEQHDQASDGPGRPRVRPVPLTPEPGGRARISTPVVGVLALFHVLVFAAYYQWRLSTPTSVLGSDLRAFYTGWRIVLDGRAPKLYDIAEQIRAQSSVMGRPMTTDTVLAYVNPPYVSLAFAWLGLFRVQVAYALFSALQLVSLGLACRMMLRREMGGWTTSARVTFLASGVLSSATLSAITLGTFTPTILLAVVAIGGEYRAAVRSGRDVASGRVGVWLAVLTIKPQLAVFVLVALLATRQWKVLRAGIAIGAGVTAVSSALCGAGIWWRYAQLLRLYGGSNGKFGGDSRYMWNVRGFLSRLDGLALRDADRIADVVFVAGVCLFGVWVHRTWSKRTAATPGVAFERIVIAALVLTVLLTPHCNRQDMLLLLPALVALVNLRRAVSPSTHGIDWFVIVSCLLSAVALMWDNDPYGYALHPLTLLALVTGVLVWRIRGRNAPGRVEVAGNLVAL